MVCTCYVTEDVRDVLLRVYVVCTCYVTEDVRGMYVLCY